MNDAVETQTRPLTEDLPAPAPQSARNPVRRF